MNPIDTDPSITAEDMAEGKAKLAFLTTGIKRLLSLFLGDDFSFIIIARHKTQANTMLIFGDVDSPSEMSSIITEGYERHKSPEMNSFTEAELYAPVNKH